MLHYLDIFIIFIYLLTVSVIGYIQGKKDKDTVDFFLAGRNMGLFPVLISVLATEISAITFIGTPEEGYLRHFLYFQFAIGSLFGRILIAFILLPAFFNRKIGTIYHYLKNRYGPRTHILSSIFFIITRIMASGVRLFAASLALSVALSWDLSLCIALISLAAVLYTTFGGLKAVIMTDIIQIFIFFGGAVLVLIYLFHHIPGGFSGIIDYLNQYQAETGINKLQIFDFSFSFDNPKSFYVSVLFGCFMTFAALGADQDLAQRLISCKNLKKSQRAIILTGIIDFPVVLLFLFIGSSLFVFFKQGGHALPIENSAKIFPYFIVNYLPYGFKGLLISGVIAAAMSSLDSAMNALASSAVLDFVKPYFKTNAGEKELMKISRFMIIFFGLALVGFALLCQGQDQILFLAFKLVSFTYGPLLGVFCLGILTNRGTDKGNIVAFMGSLFVTCFLYFSRMNIAWSYYIVIGTLSAFIIGCFFNKKNDDN